MPYYHVYIDYVTKASRKSVSINRLDLSEEELKTKIVLPYLSGEPFLFECKPIDPADVEGIRVYRTNKIARDYLDFINEEYNMLAGEGSVWKYIPGIGKDVTEEFITSLPRTVKTVETSQSVNDVFIVHGRDHKPMRELKELLRELGLNPIVLHEQASGSRTLIEKLEKHSNVGYAFVLLTPDDAGYCQYERRVLSEDFAVKVQLKLQKLRNLVKKEYDVNIAEMMKGFVNVLRGRARQNVVFEFGYFISLLSRDRVCCLYKRDVELPSDIQGIVYIPFKDSIIDVRDKIVKELEHAGYQLRAIARSLTEEPS